MTQINWARPIKFRGKDNPVRFVSYIKNGAPGINKVIVVYSIDSNPNYEVIAICNTDGTFTLDPSWDIINVPTKKTYYANVYKGTLGLSFGAIYSSEDEAESWARSKDFVKTISFEVEEGE